MCFTARSTTVALLLALSPVTTVHAAFPQQIRDFCMRLLTGKKTEVAQPKTQEVLLSRPLATEIESEEPANEPVEFHRFEDLMRAFSSGYTPDFSQKRDSDAFNLYRRAKFGDPTTDLLGDSMQQLIGALQKHPGLKKEPFREFHISVVQKRYPVTPALRAFLESQLKSAGQLRSNLFQIDANQGFWKKILQYKGRDNAQFAAFLEALVSNRDRTMILDATLPLYERAGRLFEVLMLARSKLSERGRNVRPISQAIIDLIHTIGFHDAESVALLKKEDGLARIQAYRSMLAKRDEFAMFLGFKGHFEEALAKLGVASPSGLANAQFIETGFSEIQNDVESKATVDEAECQLWTIRSLSLIEAPFRSCLGGSDCSSRTYFLKALDPNFNYFTFADERGHSSGHVTVVLGTARGKNGQEIKTAFVDKIQNIVSKNLPMFLEGVRRSVLERGYVLALPEVQGNSENGLSNESETRSFVRDKIAVEAERLAGFTPHPSPYEFEFKNQYSRAYDALPMREIAPLLIDAHGVTMQSGEIHPAWKGAKYEIDELVQSVYALKNGDLNDKISYIHSMSSVASAGLRADPEFDSTLKNWLRDPAQPITLKREVILFRVGQNHWDKFPDYLQELSNAEAISILQYCLDTPRYRREFFGVRPHRLIPIARFSKGVRNQLIDVSFHGWPDQTAVVDVFLASPQIADAASVQLFHIMQYALFHKPPNLVEGAKIRALVGNDEIYRSVEPTLLKIIHSSIDDTSIASRALANAFLSQDATEESKMLGMQVLESLDQSWLSTQAFRRLIEATDIWAWLKSNPPIDEQLEVLYGISLASGTSQARKEELAKLFSKDLRERVKTLIASRNPPRRGCFEAGTPVLTPTGPKSVESIKAGDTVLSYDLVKKKVVHGKVKRTFRFLQNEYFKVRMTNGDLFSVTAEHPFYSPSKKAYVKVSDLKTGADVALLRNGQTVPAKVTSIEKISSPDGTQVYNFHVDGFMNYFVGKGILVHNKSIM